MMNSISSWCGGAARGRCADSSCVELQVAAVGSLGSEIGDHLRIVGAHVRIMPPQRREMSIALRRSGVITSWRAATVIRTAARRAVEAHLGALGA